MQNRSLLKEPGLQRVTSPWQNLGFFLWGWLIFQVLGEILSLCFSDAVSSGSVSSLAANMAINLIAYAVIFLGFAVYIFWAKPLIRHTIWRGFFKDGGGIMEGFSWFILCLLVSSLYSYLVALIPWMSDNANQEGVTSLVTSFPLPAFLMVVVFAPFTEELAYRGGLNTLIGRWHRAWGLFISALIFALIHFDFTSIVTAIDGSPTDLYIELLNLPSYFISGLGLGLAYQSTGNIVSSWFCHTFNNLVAYIGMFI